ncbi:DUF2802 domain-containing protein [Agaribacter marinus]|uniref:DNA repair ATPase n=1 Tax=Agaribacter marinus TaxID=1431249 RepID=A0AA37SYQ3_9ALTE|nr:DUF2802 domain-containing protein [Agaribacter marinus]GLR70704.1 DNA repair ATPase [Agaribacter marinus]
MNDSVWLIVFSSVILLLIAIAVVTFLYSRSTRAKLLQSIGLIDNLHKLQQQNDKLIKGQTALIATQSTAIENLKNEMSEQIEKTNKLAQEFSLYGDKVEQLSEQDPELKMYSKANKLVASGESIDDIIEASGLPRAEVEVLYSLHRR